MTIIIISIITSVVLCVSITYFVKEIIEHDLKNLMEDIEEF
jgi:C4-dicarboxylate transporter